MVPVIFALFLWQAAAMAVQSPALPTPVAVAARLGGVWRELAVHTLTSMARLLAGAGLALVTGLTAGIALGSARGRGVGEMFSPALYAAAAVPKAALLPVVMLAFGLGGAAKAALVFLTLVFPITLACRDSVAAIPHEYFDSYRAVKASARVMLRHIILPGCAPGALAALRGGIAAGMSALFFAESFGTSRGLGYYTMDMWLRLDYPAMYLGIAMMAAVGIAVSCSRINRGA